MNSLNGLSAFAVRKQEEENHKDLSRPNSKGSF